MNGKFWKWLNRIFATGIWLPSVYVWSENQRQRAAGKTEFGIEDTFHDRSTQYESPLKMQAYGVGFPENGRCFSR